MVSSVSASLLLFSHPFVLQPQPSSGYGIFCLMKNILTAAFVDIFFGTCNPSMTTAILGRLEACQ